MGDKPRESKAQALPSALRLVLSSGSKARLNNHCCSLATHAKTAISGSELADSHFKQPSTRPSVQNAHPQPPRPRTRSDRYQAPPAKRRGHNPATHNHAHGRSPIRPASPVIASTLFLYINVARFLSLSCELEAIFTRSIKSSSETQRLPAHAAEYGSGVAPEFQRAYPSQNCSPGVWTVWTPR
jgi:hypothetical protein